MGLNIGRILILGAALLMPDAALACRANLPPQARVNRDFDAIVMVRVVSAGYTAENSPERRPWVGTTRVRRSISGVPVAGVLKIGRSGSTAACDDGIPPPKAGDEWVLYLQKTDGKLRAVQSYPLAMAIRFDPRLKGYKR